jgi:hypothetical protein
MVKCAPHLPELCVAEIWNSLSGFQIACGRQRYGLNDLPPEIQWIIFNHLDHNSLANVSRASRQLAEVTKSYAQSQEGKRKRASKRWQTRGRRIREWMTSTPDEELERDLRSLGSQARVMVAACKVLTRHLGELLDNRQWPVPRLWKLPERPEVTAKWLSDSRARFMELRDIFYETLTAEGIIIHWHGMEDALCSAWHNSRYDALVRCIFSLPGPVIAIQEFARWLRVDTERFFPKERATSSAPFPALGERFETLHDDADVTFRVAEELSKQLSRICDKIEPQTRSKCVVS